MRISAEPAFWAGDEEAGCQIKNGEHLITANNDFKAPFGKSGAWFFKNLSDFCKSS